MIFCGVPYTCGRDELVALLDDLREMNQSCVSLLHDVVHCIHGQ